MSKKPEEHAAYAIAEETLARTLRCQKGFSCLKSPREDLCLIDSCVNGQIHFIKCLNKERCAYQGTFGHGVICYCPTRKELFNKHGV